MGLVALVVLLILIYVIWKYQLPLKAKAHQLLGMSGSIQILNNQQSCPKGSSALGWIRDSAVSTASPLGQGGFGLTVCQSG